MLFFFDQWLTWVGAILYPQGFAEVFIIDFVDRYKHFVVFIHPIPKNHVCRKIGRFLRRQGGTCQENQRQGNANVFDKNGCEIF